MTELEKFSQQINNLQKSKISLIQKFIDLEHFNEQQLLKCFPGWHKKLNISQYSILQRVLHRQNYNSISNKFIFDIESNKYGEKKIVQFAYYVIDDNNNIIDKDMYYVFNEGVYSDYYNKIKYPTLKEFGISPYLLFYKLQHITNQCNLMIGHNILTFDCGIVKRYFKNFDLTLDLSLKDCYDTMKQSRYITNLKNKNGGSKCATLTELSQFFGIETNCDENFHDALYDVHITYMCYVNLMKLN